METENNLPAFVQKALIQPDQLQVCEQCDFCQPYGIKKVPHCELEAQYRRTADTGAQVAGLLPRAKILYTIAAASLRNFEPPADCPKQLNQYFE
ncbi:hypothetical protein GF362_05450 [Candidatus Dojkabacteria bacterium]|nr:hypothetical protein [Candidatus Dojkabacteria bacterium]